MVVLAGLSGCEACYCCYFRRSRYPMIMSNYSTVVCLWWSVVLSKRLALEDHSGDWLKDEK